uniref:Ribonuclease H-like domain-containing protein n=1 Tax=Tanacetum cinerariifolium TaxID=118510 RepID=A0A699H5Q5_TANCI|nr:ribonuclease H-like domain-containing protein [Tanacetum cinerariifolium]
MGSHKEWCNLAKKIVKCVTTEMPITTVEEKAQSRLEVKARSTLMMGISNEHQLKFNSIKDAKKLLEAVKKRFCRNSATKNTQRNLLKHGNGYERKGRNRSQNWKKIKHKMESVEKPIKSKPKSKSNQSKPGTDLERARKTKAEGVNILLG